MDSRAHANSFGAAAELYDRIRPRYPADALRWAIGEAPCRIVDLGAGTGILTRQLVALGHDVIAVEPDDQMRGQIGSETLSGTAEHIPLGDSSADAVVAGQSYHWFDRDPAHVEIARVLRPDGIFAPIWNVRDESEPWVAALSRLLDDAAGVERHATLDERTLPADAFGDRFGPVRGATFRWAQPHTPHSLVQLVKSRSYYLLASAGRRAEIEASVRELAATHAGLAGREEFALPYVTYAYRAHRHP